MERLTHRETPENKAYVDRGLVELHWYSMTDEGYRGPAIDRLAAYEDTGLEPDEFGCVNLGTGCDATQICVCHGLIRKAVKELEEYKALGPIEHLRTIVKAEEALRKEAK